MKAQCLLKWKMATFIFQIPEASMNITSVHLKNVFCCKMLYKPAQTIFCSLLNRSNLCSHNYSGKNQTKTSWKTKNINVFKSHISKLK